VSWSADSVNQVARRASGSLLQRALRLDPVLLGLLILLSGVGAMVLYSAFGNRIEPIQNHAIRLGAGFALMVVMAQIPPWRLAPAAPWLYVATLLALTTVFLVGEFGGGARRWLEIGPVRFQPSEVMKLALPLMIAWLVARGTLPIKLGKSTIGLLMIGVPAAMISVQPDLGTAVVVAATGLIILFLAGASWRSILALAAAISAAAPALWIFGMQGYQRQRVLTFLDPERDPLGAGYNIIQAKIAIGSGGIFGKGWTNGTQAHLDFIPERHTDFVFAVLAEEFGLLGVIMVVALYGAIIARALWITYGAQDTFSRLLAGGLTLTFFLYSYVNMGMVVGLLPVVGLPLPLISYGGSSIVTLMAGFGILMAIHSHRRMWSA